jgi:hypothetical protein
MFLIGKWPNTALGSLVNNVAAVHDSIVTLDKVTVARCEKDDYLSDLLGLAETTERHIGER